MVVLSDRDGDSLLVLDAAGRKELKRFKIGKRPTDVLMAPDGSRAYIAISGDDTVAIFDLKTLEVTGRISVGSVGSVPKGVAWVGRR